VAKALARDGAHVVAVARTVGGLEELDDAIKKDGGSATLVPLDLADLEGLARLGAALNERYGKLDVLIGNAGVLGPASPLGHIEPKQWADVMTINVTANFSRSAAWRRRWATPTPARPWSFRWARAATAGPKSARTPPPKAH